MKTKWLLEKDMFDDDLDSIVAELKRQNFEYKISSYIPFGGNKTYLSLFDRNDCVLFYGSLQMARQIKKEASWIPGIYCNLPKFECTYYYSRLGKYLTNKQYIMLPFGELKRRKEFLTDTLGVDGCVFVRPSCGFKTFTGKVIDSRTWDKDVDFLGFYDVAPEQVVIAAKPLMVKKEWRFVVGNNKIVAGGEYTPEKTFDAPKEITQFAKHVVDDCNYEPDVAWCLDVCEESDGELSVMEVGSFSCAGLYHINKEPIVEEISKLALKEWEEYN